MPQTIEVVGEGDFEFPDSMTEDQMARALRKHFLQRDKEEPMPMGDRAQVALGELADSDVVRGFVEAPQRIVKTVMAPFQTASKLARGVATDVMAGNVLPSGQNGFRPTNLPNTEAAMTDQPMPDEAGLHPMQRGVADAAGSLPVVAGGMMASAVPGTGPAMAFGAVMGMNALASGAEPMEAVQQGVIGAVLPGAGALGKNLAAKVLARAVQAGTVSAESVVTHKALESLGSQAGMTALAELARAPEYMAMDPEQRKEAMVRSLAANFANLAMELPSFAKGVPSETQRMLHEEATATVEDYLRQGMEPQKAAAKAMGNQLRGGEMSPYTKGAAGNEGVEALPSYEAMWAQQDAEGMAQGITRERAMRETQARADALPTVGREENLTADYADNTDGAGKSEERARNPQDNRFGDGGTAAEGEAAPTALDEFLMSSREQPVENDLTRPQEPTQPYRSAEDIAAQQREIERQARVEAEDPVKRQGALAKKLRKQFAADDAAAGLPEIPHEQFEHPSLGSVEAVVKEATDAAEQSRALRKQAGEKTITLMQVGDKFAGFGADATVLARLMKVKPTQPTEQIPSRYTSLSIRGLTMLTPLAELEGYRVVVARRGENGAFQPKGTVTTKGVEAYHAAAERAGAEMWAERSRAQAEKEASEKEAAFAKSSALATKTATKQRAKLEKVKAIETRNAEVRAENERQAQADADQAAARARSMAERMKPVEFLDHDPTQEAASPKRDEWSRSALLKAFGDDALLDVWHGEAPTVSNYADGEYPAQMVQAGVRLALTLRQHGMEDIADAVGYGISEAVGKFRGMRGAKAEKVLRRAASGATDQASVIAGGLLNDLANVAMGDVVKFRDAAAERLHALGRALEWAGKPDLFGQTRTALQAVREFAKVSEESTKDYNPASVVESTLPRRLETGVPTVGAGELIGPTEIRQYLSEALDIPIRLGVGGVKAKGFFRTKPEVIRMKLLNNIPTIAHEVGHYLHKLLFPTATPDSAGLDAYLDFGRQHDAELLALGARTSKPSYSAKQVQMEGAAEGMRLWLTDPAQALAQAPGFTTAWEAAVTSQHPEVMGILRNGQEQIRQYIAQPGWMQLRAHIARGLPEVKVPMRERVRGWYNNWVTELAPLERSMAELQRLGLPADQANLVTRAATNYLGGVANMVEAALMHEQRDYSGQRVGPSYREILAKVPGHDTVGLGDYMVAKRVLELQARGKETGFTPQQARETVAKLAHMEPMRQELNRFQQNNLRLLRDGGLISDGQMRAMEEQNRDYVPFYRAVESVAGGVPGGKAGKGFTDLPQGVGHYKGSDLKVVDPLESILKNLWVFRDLAERNRVVLTFVDAVNATTGGGRVADGVAKRVAPSKISSEEVAAYLQKMGLAEEVPNPQGGTTLMGMDPKGNPIDLSGNLGFLVWRAAQTESARKGIFKVWREGKEEFYQLDDADLYKSLKLSDASDAQFFSRFGLLKPLRKMTSMLRSGSTLSPEFIVRNLGRDQLTAGVYSRTGVLPFYDAARMLFSAAKRDDLYWDWRANGGGHGEFTGSSRKSLQEALAETIKDPAELKTALGYINPLNILKGLQRAGQMVEEATRLAEYSKAKQAGVDPREAVNQSKDLTLNFNRAGFYGKMVNQMLAFFNAGIQDLDKFGREHKWALDAMRGKVEKEALKRGGTVALKAMAYITLPSAVAWWLGKDDEKIQSLPNWRKNLFWNVNLGKMSGGEDFVFSFPKPFLLGQVYGSSFEHAADHLTKRDPAALRHLMTGLWSQTLLNTDNLLVTGIRAPVENVVNYSFFQDRPLETDAQQKLSPFMRANVTTSETAKQLAKLGKLTLPDAFEFSPIKFDNSVRGLFGSMGQYGTSAIDYALGKVKVLDIPPAPEKGWTEMPVIRGLTVGPYAPSADVQRFYAGSRLAEQRLTDFKTMAPNLKGAFESRWWGKEREAVAFYEGGQLSQLRDLGKYMGDISTAMQTIKDSRDIAPADKAKRLADLTAARDRLAKIGVGLLWPGDRVKVY